MKAIIYARCSTDESRQDVKNQLVELRKYCKLQGWEYDEKFEYVSAFKKVPPELEKIIEKIRRREYQILIVYSLDRFSRLIPTKTVGLIHKIVEDYRCRFIALIESIDSNSDMWQIIMMIFAWMSNAYSKRLGERIRDAIKRQKANGEYIGGRKEKKVDEALIQKIHKENPLFGLRKIAEHYNSDRPKKDKISYVTIGKFVKERICLLKP